MMAARQKKKRKIARVPRINKDDKLLLPYKKKIFFSLLLIASFAFAQSKATSRGAPPANQNTKTPPARRKDARDTHPIAAKTNSEESEGEALFKENKGEKAIASLEREIAAGDNSADKYNYLGLSYYQAGDYEHSIAAFERGMQAADDGQVPSSRKWALYYNAGNSAFALGNFESAEGYYSDAYRMNGEFHASLLNRANARLNQDKLVEARDDYALYLERCPESAQAERIRALLELLDEEIKKHAILPEKLEIAVAVLPVAAIDGAEEEAVAGIYPAAPLPPPAASEAMEKEAAFLQSEMKEAAASEAIEKGDVPAIPAAKSQTQSEAVEKEASLLQKKAPAAADAETFEDAAVPPLPESKNAAKENAASSETVEKEAFLQKKTSQPAPSAEAVEKTNPPPETTRSKKSKLEAIKDDAPPLPKTKDNVPESRLEPLEAIPYEGDD